MVAARRSLMKDMVLPESTSISTSRPWIHARNWNALLDTPPVRAGLEMAMTTSS